MVVQDALETMWWFCGSYCSSFTPITKVPSIFLPGAEIITFLAPASMCACAFEPSVKKPVDSSTTSTPRSFQGRSAGLRSARILISLPSTTSTSSLTSTSTPRRPIMESYLSKLARVFGSVRSLIATISKPSASARAARKKVRPMRPKPLIATRTVTGVSPCQCIEFDGLEPLFMGLMREPLEFFVSRWLRVRRCCYNRTLVYVRLGVFLSGIFVIYITKLTKNPLFSVVLR